MRTVHHVQYAHITVRRFIGGTGCLHSYCCFYLNMIASRQKESAVGTKETYFVYKNEKPRQCTCDEINNLF